MLFRVLIVLLYIATTPALLASQLHQQHCDRGAIPAVTASRTDWAPTSGATSCSIDASSVDASLDAAAAGASGGRARRRLSACCAGSNTTAVSSIAAPARRRCIAAWPSERRGRAVALGGVAAARTTVCVALEAVVCLNEACIQEPLA